MNDIVAKNGWGDDPYSPDLESENNKLKAVFYDREMVDIVATKKRKETVYKAVTYIRIPVDDKTIVDRQMMPIDRVKWKRAWAKYKNQAVAEPDGIPIEQSPHLDLDIKQNLMQMGIDTIDEFTSLTDDNVANFGPGMVEAKYKLLDWMKSPEYAAKLAKQELQREGSNAIGELQKKLEAQQELINKLLTSKPKGKRGRKRKIEFNQPQAEQVA